MAGHPLAYLQWAIWHAGQPVLAVGTMTLSVFATTATTVSSITSIVGLATSSIALLSAVVTLAGLYQRRRLARIRRPPTGTPPAPGAHRPHDDQENP